MAFQTVRVTFTAEQGPKVASFPTPAGNVGLGAAAPTVTDTPTAGVFCWCDVPVSGGGTTTFNVYASDVFTGYIDIPIEDKP